MARHRADEALKSRILEFIAKSAASGRELATRVNTCRQLRGSLHLYATGEIDISGIEKIGEPRHEQLHTAVSSLRRKNNCYYVVSTAAIYLYHGYRLSHLASASEAS